jgi:hypothetical protein
MTVGLAESVPAITYGALRFLRSSRMACIRPTAATTLAMIETSSSGVISRPYAERRSLCSARVKGRLLDYEPERAHACAIGNLSPSATASSKRRPWPSS